MPASALQMAGVFVIAFRATDRTAPISGAQRRVRRDKVRTDPRHVESQLTIRLFRATK